jgi:hypothetical protein
VADTRLARSSPAPEPGNAPPTAAPTAIPAAAPDVDDLVGDWFALPDFARAIGLPLPRVRQWLREGRIVAVRRGDPPAPQVPAAFAHCGALVKGLPGTLTVLRDSGLGVEAALRWLFSTDPSLPGRPVDALREGRHREVNRRAQALAL